MKTVCLQTMTQKIRTVPYYIIQQEFFLLLYENLKKIHNFQCKIKKKDTHKEVHVVQLIDA